MKVVVINGVVLLLGILLIEVFFGFWWPGKGQLQKINVLTNIERQFDICAYYDRQPCQIQYTRDSNGLRGDYRNLKDIDIITVGGSTTDQLYIDDQETWDSVLMKELKKKGVELNIVNGGVEGQSTVGHIANFKWWYPNLPELKPKYILFYIGINDLYVTASRMRKHDKMIDDQFTQFIKNRSAIIYFYRRIRGAILARQVNAVHQKSKDLKLNTESNYTNDDYLTFLTPNLPDFSQRVLQLAELSRQMGAQPIFISQTRRIFAKNGVLASGAGGFNIGDKYFSYLDLYHMQKIVNNRLRETCSSNNLTCFDLASEIDLQPDDFYDDAHNTVSGAKKIGLYLAEKMHTYLEKK